MLRLLAQHVSLNEVAGYSEIAPNSVPLGADHLTLEGGVDDFEKKFPASPCQKKKIACSTNEIEIKFLHCCKQQKKCCKAISSFQGDFTKSQQNCNHSSLAPFKLWSWLCFRMCNAFLAL